MKFNNYSLKNYGLAFSVPVQGFTEENKLLKKLNTFSRKRKGFTLAEVLITLTIIGVIAAMTVPTLMSNYTKQTYVTGLKKAYSQLTNAIKMMQINAGCSVGDMTCTGWNDGSTLDGYSGMDYKRPYLLSKQFKVQKFCHQQNGAVLSMEECIPTDKYKEYTLPGYGAFITDDGMTFVSSSGFDIHNSHTGTYFYVDVNGPKGPNKMGRDIFHFYIISEPVNGIQEGTIVPSGSKLTSKFGFNEDWKTKCTPSTVAENNYWSGAAQCTARVLETGKMDY